MAGEWLGDVLVTDKASVPSGTKIKLNNRSENGTSYKWEVYYEGIKMATSLVENPQIYVYNEGSYSFFLTAYSGKCESSVNWESGVEVQSGTLRYANIVEPGDFVYEAQFPVYPREYKHVYDNIVVYPTKIDNEVNVICNGPFSYSVYNASGMLMVEGEGKDQTTINSERLNPGVYTVVVNGSTFSIIK